MITFLEWIEKRHPEFDEGLLSNIRGSAKKVIGASNKMIGGLGVFSRLYAPLVAGAMAVGGGANQAQAPQAATQNYPVYPLTKVPPLDDLGSQVGHPDSQGWYDAADWIPAQDEERAAAQRAATKGGQEDRVTGFVDPLWRPKPIGKKRKRR